jgi:hypothetical protein
MIHKSMSESGGWVEVHEEEGGDAVYFISKASAKVALTLLGLEGRSCRALPIIHHCCHPESAPRSLDAISLLSLHRNY